ncbi:MAG: TolC family protein [Lentisphaeria bacterium]|nr:TolC family protein [Lentisphaeria bacterium]
MKKYTWSLCGAALLMLGVGCETYVQPPSDFEGDTYTQRKRSAEANDLLKDVTVLTLEKAQEIALANNPNYISAYYAITQAKMRYYQALGAYSPVVSLNTGASHADTWNYNQQGSTNTDHSRSFNYSVGASVNWTLFDGLSREFQVKISEAGFDLQKELTEDDCRLLIRNVAYAYNQLLLAKENIRIANEDMAFQIKNLNYTELKLKVGAVPLSDVLNFRTQANSAEGNRITAEYQYEIALYALAALMGYPDGTLPPSIKFPAMDKVALNALPSVDVYLDNALANRPDLQSYRTQLKIVDYQLKQSYSAYSPTLNAFADFGFAFKEGKDYTTYGNNVTRNKTPSFSYGVNANWTVFNGFIRYNRIREAQALLAATRFDVAGKWMAVVEEVRNAHINYVQSVKKARLYENQLAIASKQRDLVDEQYRAGNAALTRLNEAQRDLVDAQTQLASAYITVQNAKAQLEAAAAMNAGDYDRMPAVFSADDMDATGLEVKPALRKAVPEIPVKPVEPLKVDKDGYPIWDPDHLAI